MGEHTVTSFDEELNSIDQLIREMSDSARSMVSSSVRALLSQNQEEAQRVVFEDSLMDRRQRELDDRAIRLIARRQPMAQDLRTVIGAIRMAGDLERIGDLAKNIAKRANVLQEVSLPEEALDGINKMAELVLAQIGGVIDKYVLRNSADLLSLRSEDEKIDFLYTSVFNGLIGCMNKNHKDVVLCVHLLFCAKNLERIGDHVTNIAENVYFVVTGKSLSHSRPKLDQVLPFAQSDKS